MGNKLMNNECIYRGSFNTGKISYIRSHVQSSIRDFTFNKNRTGNGTFLYSKVILALYFSFYTGKVFSFSFSLFFLKKKKKNRNLLHDSRHSSQSDRMT
jgi:hypothetical protein